MTSLWTKCAQRRQKTANSNSWWVLSLYGQTALLCWMVTRFDKSKGRFLKSAKADAFYCFLGQGCLFLCFWEINRVDFADLKTACLFSKFTKCARRVHAPGCSCEPVPSSVAQSLSAPNGNCWLVWKQSLKWCADVEVAGESATFHKSIGETKSKLELKAIPKANVRKELCASANSEG